MSDELELAIELERETFLEVVKLYTESKTPTEIQNATGVPFSRQREIRQQWFALVNDPRWAENRSKELVAELDEGYKSLLRRMEQVYDQAYEEGDLKLQKEILKELANIRKLSAEVFLKAGILNKDSIGDDIAEMLEEKAKIIDILKEVAQEYPDAGKLIQRKLMELDGKTASTRVDQ